MITFELDDKATQATAGLGPKIEAAIQAAVTEIAYSALAAAQLSLQRGPKTGRIYKRRKVRHQASAPGEAPATDTGRLVSSLKVEIPSEKWTANLVAGVPYAIHLEYGTRHMKPRPFMRPAGDAQRATAAKVFDKHLRKATR